jgi:hypothetical protein
VIEWLPELVALGTSIWGAVETARRKRAVRLAKEKEAARQKAIAEQVAKIQMTGEGIESILDRLKNFDEFWRPIKKPPEGR